MKSRPLLILGVVAAMVASWPHPVAAQSGTAPSTLYQLGPNSAFITGCFGPCACFVLIPSKMQGTFVLQQIGFDGLYTTYAVSDVQWSVPGLPTPIQIRGSGTFRVGGEVALQQELALDLTLNSSAPFHFDSGLVSGGGGFPAIDIRTSLHQEMACTDSVLDVKASPAVPTSADGGTAAERAIRVSVVSPFYAATAVRLGLARSERVDIDVFDARGRLVRRLAQNRLVSSGTNVVPWDGLSDRGRQVAAGIYVVRVRAEGATIVRRAVKLK